LNEWDGLKAVPYGYGRSGGTIWNPSLRLRTILVGRPETGPSGYGRFWWDGL